MGSQTSLSFRLFISNMQYSSVSLLRSSVLGRRCLSSDTLTTVRREGGVEHITLANPKTRNALSLDMMKKITEDISRAGEDKTVRTIVLRGEGQVFSAGHNLKEMTVETGYDYHMEIFNTCEKMMLLIGQVPVPVLGVVTGLAAAAGCQMISSCDLVVAAPSARFSTPGAAVGLFCHTPGIPLARRVPRAVSGYMLLTGETISAEEAYNAGLVSKLVQEDKMDEEVERICAAIASKPRGVIALGKRFYQHQLELPLSPAYTAGGKVMADNLWYKDAQEGIAAFKEKRRPVFSHTDGKVEG